MTSTASSRPASTRPRPARRPRAATAVVAVAGPIPVDRITENAEDYLERIEALIRDKGYARVTDLAGALGLSRPSVSGMVQRLAQRGYLEYERYRGFRLTAKGRQVSAHVRRRHEILTEFLSLLEVPAAVREHDVEGLEHHLSRETLSIIERVVRRWKQSPELLDGLGQSVS